VSYFDTAPYIEDLIHWIQEREYVRVRKEIHKASPPWTPDPIIQSTRFTNVHREDDKVTKWLRTHWYKPHESSPNLAFSACLARVVNWPTTLEVLGFPSTWSPSEFIRIMGAQSANGSRKIWGGAYMVTGGYSAGGENKQTIIARVLDEAFEACKVFEFQVPEYKLTLQDAFDVVSQTKGLGTFLAAQVVADLKYTPLLDGASDWVTFCAPGPGSSMGLNFLYGRTPAKGIGEIQFSMEVNALREWLLSTMGIELTAHDTQNCLCEFSKYVRIKYLGGRAKTGYPGATP
jgi:5-hmdU DNA kinase, helical domain